VVGVCLTDHPNTAVQIAEEFDRSASCEVHQRWVGMGRARPTGAIEKVTAGRFESLVPKFAVLNRQLLEASIDAYDFMIVCDDDIILPPGFLDAYLALVQKHDLALCQPARSHNSFIDHPFVEQLDGIDARWTRFVEIGPLVSIRRDAAAHLLPFDESSPMGWGYDLAWPCVVESLHLRMGIVDAVPVSHALRKPVQHYRRHDVDRQMRAYLDGRPHLSSDEAFFIIESYA
jgi:hypothetical protein